VKVRTEARRDAILEVASQVFLEFGFERTSMSEIVKRIGGSKSTIYGYFPSKEALFLAVTHAAGKKHMDTALADFAAYKGGDLLPALTRFSEKLVGFLWSDEAVAVQRMVLGEAGHSDIGQLYYEGGPKRGLLVIAEVFRQAMERGELRREDPWMVAQHFGSLIQAEHQHRWFCREVAPLAKTQVKRTAERAVAVFIRAYGPDPETAQGL
jgi:AcrR family transcriptional regulator